MVYISMTNFGMGRIASLGHPMPFSSYDSGAGGDGCMPTRPPRLSDSDGGQAFSDPPHPFLNVTNIF